MKRLYYDLHTHSCLSPCADNDNTPNNLLGMAHLSGLDVLALTDHNTAKNCPAFFAAAKNYGIIPIAGMELTTSEDIHIVFLFYELCDALKFDEYVEKRRILIKNRPDIFGEQLILDKDDNVIGTDEFLLSNATDISVENVKSLAEEFGAICYPAHIDRDANGIISILGTLPPTPKFNTLEFRDAEKIEEYKKRYGIQDGTVIVVDSDSHYLTDMRDKENYLEISESEDESEIRKRFLDLLR